MDTEGFTPLSELLNDEPSTAPDVVEEPQPEPEPEPASQPRDENGRFAKKGEDESASPAPVEEPPYEHAAVKGERTRRQEAERQRDEALSRISALEAQFQSLQQPQEPPAPPPSFWEDEQGWETHLENRVGGNAGRQGMLWASQFDASRAHPDFAEMKGRFLEMAQGNPALAQQALADEHPWEKAYQIAKNASQMAELGATNLDELKARMREELLAEMAQSTPPATLPPTLTAERNVGARSGPTWSGPTPLAELLRR